jgi:hypothetical protein
MRFDELAGSVVETVRQHHRQPGQLLAADATQGFSQTGACRIAASDYRAGRPAA